MKFRAPKRSPAACPAMICRPAFRFTQLPLLAAACLCLAIRPVQAAPGDTSRVMRRVLPNGLTVLAETRRTAPVVTVMMWYRVGSRDELPGETGIAHFVEHLMFKGTPGLAKGEIDRITMQAGGSNNAFTGPDYTAFVFNLPAHRWQTALQIEADRMRNSRFITGEFEAERQVVIEERRSGEDDPGQRLYEQVNGVSFLAHPYRNPVIGWMSDLKRLTRQQVQAFYRRHYVPANATCVVVGDVDPAEAIREARRAFAGVPRLPAPPRARPVEPPQAGERRVTVRLDAQAPRLIIQFHTPRRGHPHLPALEVTAQAMAGGKSSRLYRRLVEGEQLATDVIAEIGDALDPDTSTFTLTLKPGASLQRAEAALLEELRRATETPLEAEALTRAKIQIETSFLRDQDTAQERASLLGEAASLTGLDHLDRYLPRIAAVQPDQARRVAALYFTDTNRTVGWLVPKTPPKVEPGGSGIRRSATQSDTERPRILPECRACAASEGPRQRGTPANRRPVSANPLTHQAAVNPIRPPSVPPRLRVESYRRVGRRQSDPGPRFPRLEPSPGPHFSPLPVVRRVLANGLTLLLLESHDTPLFTAAALVRAGSRNEPEAKAGLAHFTAAMLDGGAAGRSDLEIARLLETLGVDYDATAGSSMTTARIDGLSRALRPALAVWADLLRRPSFPDAQVTSERERILAGIRSTADDPEEVASQAFHELVYGAHPAHRPVEGYERTVAALGRDDLVAFHRAHYAPNRTTIAMVGDFRAAELLPLLERLFGDWPRAEPPPERLPAPVKQTARRERRLALPKEQTQIVLGHLGVTRRNPDYVALEVLDTILGTGAGGTFTARIPQQLRDVEGLAYTVGASITATAGDDPGVFAASMGVQPRNMSRAVAGLLREIRRIRAHPVSRKELQDAVNYLTGSYVFDFETDEQLAAYLLEVEHYRLGLDYRDRYPAMLRAVTAADLLRVARRYLDPDRYTLIIVGPAAKVDATARSPHRGRKP